MRVVISLAESADGTWGGLTRFLSLAKELFDRGHEIAFFIPEKLNESIDKKYKIYNTPESTFFGLPLFLSKILTRYSQEATPPVKEGKDFGDIWLIFRIKGFTNKSYLLTLVKKELAFLDDFHPDILISNLDLGLFIAASITHIPLVTMYSSIKERGINSKSWQIVRKSINAVLKHYHIAEMNPHDLCYGEQVFKIVPSIPELETVKEEKTIHYVGGMEAQGERGENVAFLPQENKRYIFVYMGTGALPFTLVKQRVMQFMKDKGGHLCIVSSQKIKTKETRGNVEFMPYINADELLPFCDFTICHGGLNTIIQSLRYGVPLMVFPGPIFERRFNAKRVQMLQVGIMGERSNFQKEWLDTAFHQYDFYKQHTEKMKERILLYHGAQAAVDAMLHWVSEKKKEDAWAQS